jgi:hypothetical protein
MAQSRNDCHTVEQSHGPGSSEYREVYNRFQRAERDHTELRHRYLAKVLAPLQVPRAAKVTLRGGFGQAPGATAGMAPVSLTDVETRLQKRAERAVEWLQGKLASNLTNRAKGFLVKIRHDAALSRSHYDRQRGELVMRSDAPISEVLHEFGHQLEHRSQKVFQTALDFIDLRCGNEGWTHLATAFPTLTYGPDEWGRKDDFDSVFAGADAYYTGKWYTDHTELLSMGLDLLYNDPVRFANDDPDYFQVLSGILNGRLL